MNTTHMGDCRGLLQEMAADGIRVQTCITSPPYFGLRDYGVAGQIGLEPTPSEYVEQMVAVFRAVRDVLADDGTLWLNLGDSYGRGTRTENPNDAKRGTGFHAAITKAAGYGAPVLAQALPNKQLLGIPWRVAMALQADGWYLRSDIIWHKPNPMPESVTDRPTKAHEYLFLLAKSERYYYDGAAIREPDSGQDHPRNVLHLLEPTGGLMSPHRGIRHPEGRNGAGRNKRSVWTVSTTPFSGAHFATFPRALIEPCVLAGCPAMSGASHLPKDQRSGWIGGLAEWTIGRTAYLSVVFTWKLPEARSRAIWYRALGYDVMAGGPALYDQRKGFLDGLATIKRQWPDAIRHQNPDATMATRGCDEDCFFCCVPRIEGPFTYFPDFPVRPLLCDNNLSAIEVKYQDFIIERYQAAGVPLLDANSGFEPKSFDGAVFERWRKINRGPWRFGYDESKERETVRRVMKMLRDAGVPAKKIRPYVMVGCEPVESCLGRIREVIEWGGEPHVQPYINPKALERKPQVLRKMGWTAQLLTDVARWANRRIWRYAPFEEYRRSAKTSRPERFNTTEGLFA